MFHLFCNQTVNTNHTSSSSKLTFNQQKKYDHKIGKKKVTLYSLLTPFRASRVVNGSPARLLCVMGHVTTFVMNVELVAKQWQHCKGSCLSHTFTSRARAWKGRKYNVSQVFGITQPIAELILLH